MATAFIRPGGGGGVDAETVRDIIGTTLVGADGLTSIPDDAADTVTVKVGTPKSTRTALGISVMENGVVLNEPNFPGASSRDYDVATAARDAAIAACFIDPTTGGATDRPRPLVLVPIENNSSSSTGAITGQGQKDSYLWRTLDLGNIASTYGLGSSGDVRLRWGIVAYGERSTYDAVQVRMANSENFFTFPTSYNIADFWLGGFTAIGRQNYSTTHDFISLPGGRAMKDWSLEDLNVQWFRNQLNGSAGRFEMRGKCNFNNAVGKAINLGGSDGRISAQLYVDTRALPAGNFLLDLSMSSFRCEGGQIYLTPNSGGGARVTGRIEGLELAVEVNGLGDQAPEYCYDQTQHVGTGLLTGSPSHAAATYPGLIFFDLTSNTYVKSNGAAWSLYYDGTAAITFNGIANFPASPVAGKVYRNVGAGEDFASGAGSTNTTINNWIVWNGRRLGPSYFNKVAVPAWISGHVETPEYIGTDAPGILASGTRGSGNIRGSVALAAMVPGIVDGSWTAPVTVIDAKDPVRIDVETSFVNGNNPAVAVRNSGAVPVVEAVVNYRNSQWNKDDPPLFNVQRAGTVRVVEGGFATAFITADQAVPDDGVGITVSGLDVYLYPNERVEVNYELFFAGGVGDTTSAGDLVFGRTGPSGYSDAVTFAVIPPAASGPSSSINTAVGGGVTGGTFSAQHSVQAHGWVKAGATAGLYRLTLVRALTGASMPSLKSGSFVKYRRM